jgi:response regulator RpfG family c-di-GMP phosphodiesterase
MGSKKKFKILIVEDLEDLLEMLTFMVGSLLDCEIKTATNGKIALEIIKNGWTPDLIISDYNMPQMNGGELFVALRKFSNIPFILHSSDSLAEHKEFVGENIFGVLKPSAPEQFESAIAHALFSGAKKLPKFDNMQEQEYLPIPLLLIEKMRVASVPVFLKLAEDHYVKVAHGDQSYDQAELKRYKDRGQSELFLKKADLGSFIKSYQTQLTAVLYKPTTGNSKESKISPAMTAASLHFLREVQDQIGFTPEIHELTQKNIQGVLELIAQNPALEKILDIWKTSSYEYADRCTLSAVIATGLAKKLNWVSDTTADKLAFAAVLHDIGLNRDTLLRQDELEALALDSNEWTKPEMAEFIFHPKKGAEVLAKWNHCPSDVDIIVSQHHERPDGRGFPGKIPAHRIAPLSSVFIFSLDLSRYIVEKKDNANLKEWLDDRKDYFSVGGFRKIVAVIDGIVE